MRKLLDIVITHWNEPWEVGMNGIKMLSIQRRVDWSEISVTIIHDGSEAFPDEYFEDCPFVVEQVCIEHGGVSAARNYAIEHCKALWIKFCDFDDTFAGIYSVACIADALCGASKHDVLNLPFIVDVYKGGLVVRKESPVFIHDKVFRVSALRSHHIRFYEDISFSEDFAFMSSIRIHIDQSRIGNVNSNFPIYVYIQRIDSIAHDKGRWYLNRCELFKSHKHVVDEMRANNRIESADEMVARTIAENYVVIRDADERIDTSGLFNLTREYYLQNKDSFNNVDESGIESVLNETNTQNESDITKDEFLQWVEVKLNNE